MDKAINYLESRKMWFKVLDNNTVLAKSQIELMEVELSHINQALAELQAHKAKIESLKEWVMANYKHFDRIIDITESDTDFEYGAKSMCKDILQKLEELE